MAEQMLLTPNPYSRPRKKLTKVKGIVIHWYANPKSTALANRNFFENRKSGKSGYGSAHYLIDPIREIQAIPDLEMAYHVGSNVYTQSALRNLGSYPNNCTIGIEMAHDDMTGKPSVATYNRTVRKTAQLCKKYGLTELNVWTHHQVVGWKDCHRWYTNNPQEWVKFIADVAEALRGKTVIIPTPKPVKPSQMELVSILNEGDRGTEVRQLQTDLNKLGYKLEVDGIFGPATDKAVEDFQRKNKLAVDGAVGPNTSSSLAKAIANLSKPKPDNKPVSTRKVLQLPASADSWRVYPTSKAPVKTNAIGSLNPKKFGGLEYDILANPQTDVYTIKTGDFGTVNIFAASSTGAKIVTKTSSTAAPKAKPKPASKPAAKPAPASGSAIRKFVRTYKYTKPLMTDKRFNTTDIAAIQRAIGFEGSQVDGAFGFNTEKAVMRYQSRHGLTADGIVGPNTWNTLF